MQPTIELFWSWDKNSPKQKENSGIKEYKTSKQHYRGEKNSSQPSFGNYNTMTILILSISPNLHHKTFPYHRKNISCQLVQIHFSICIIRFPKEPKVHKKRKGTNTPERSGSKMIHARVEEKKATCPEKRDLLNFTSTIKSLVHVASIPNKTLNQKKKTYVNNKYQIWQPSFEFIVKYKRTYFANP